MVTSTQTTPSFTRSSAFSRALSVLLLVLIVYGTTVEAAHKHGGIPAAKQVYGVSLSDPGEAKNPGLNLVGCGDCLICQLHQNFSVAVIILRAIDASRPLRPQYVETVPLAVNSRNNTPQTGRAPPFSS